ncbi:MAG TPA: epoxyqueuosine reductase QueH, partial [bacterium]|nr:epoxyqueuosine reductase QueH [bacterium]
MQASQSEYRHILLHICCAPDATVAIDNEATTVGSVFYFYNPNIHPAAEYAKRRAEMKRLARLTDIPLICDEADSQRWLDAVRGLEEEPEGGKRCEACFRMRLERTARFARDHGFDAIATVLTVSPHKDAKLI